MPIPQVKNPSKSNNPPLIKKPWAYRLSSAINKNKPTTSAISPPTRNTKPTTIDNSLVIFWVIA
jgi:hypothetical protein